MEQDAYKSAKLDVIDITTDERVFAILDDGCNKTCAFPILAKHAQLYLTRRGQHMGDLLPLLPEKYLGIGNGVDIGTRVIPFSILLSDGAVGDGQLLSSELQDDDEVHDMYKEYLLLSLKAQQILGVVKGQDLLLGTVWPMGKAVRCERLGTTLHMPPR